MNEFDMKAVKELMSKLLHQWYPEYKYCTIFCLVTGKLSSIYEDFGYGRHSQGVESLKSIEDKMIPICKKCKHCKKQYGWDYDYFFRCGCVRDEDDCYEPFDCKQCTWNSLDTRLCRTCLDDVLNGAKRS